MKVWKGDPKKCGYCKRKEFPHQHDTDAWEKKKSESDKKAKSVAKITQPARKRGRPMKAENIELLRICECNQ